MDPPDSFYICPYCFQICEHDSRCHNHPMVLCTPGRWGAAARMPLTNPRGELKSRAPRWYLEAVGWTQAEGRYTPLHPA